MHEYEETGIIDSPPNFLHEDGDTECSNSNSRADRHDKESQNRNRYNHNRRKGANGIQPYC